MARKDNYGAGDHAPAPWPFGALGIRPKNSPPRVAVLGLARSGLGAARLLMDHDCTVELLDLKTPAGQNRRLEELRAAGAPVRIGPHDPAWLPGYDLMVKSPGVPAEIPFLVEAGRLGVCVIGELELAFLAAAGPVLAVTGTNGKSTTTAWLGDMLREGGLPVEVVGNIGRPFSEGVRRNPRAVFACEVSSFQLEDIRTFHPSAACLLNLTQDHLDRHQTMEAYREAKLGIFRNQTPGDLSLVGPDDSLAAEARPRTRGRWARFGMRDRGGEGAYAAGGALWLRRDGREIRLVGLDELALPGPHNAENAMAAAVAAAYAEVDPGALTRSLRSFAGLPHRLECVGEIGGVRFVNDSKATNIDSLAVALRSFTGHLILIAGGLGKDQDFGSVAPLVAERVSLAILIGRDAPVLKAAWGDGVGTQSAGSLEEAVDIAAKHAVPGSAVLLSPACASFDMFDDYEARGDCFRAIVQTRMRSAGKGRP